MEWDQATVHISMMGWTSISSVFEGIRAYWNEERQQLYVFHLDAHLKRLYQSMKIMRMDCLYSPEQLTDAITGLLRANDFRADAYVQPLAYFTGGIPGYEAVWEDPAEVVITPRLAPSNLGTGKLAHCNVSSWNRISDNVMPPRAKAISNYQNSRYVSTESRVNGYDYGIILNQQGKVAEASYACIFIIRDGVAITPPVSAGILESITRETVRELLENELDLPVLERDVERTELYIADEVFLCGTAVEVQPVVSVDRYRVGDGEAGPIVSRLESLFHQVVRGSHPARIPTGSTRFIPRHEGDAMKPADLDSFWRDTLEELGETPPNPRLTELPEQTHREFVTSAVTLDSFGGQRIRGWYSVPAHRWGDRRVAAILAVPGYGGAKAIPVNLALAGYAVLTLFPRGQGESLQDWDVDPGATKLTHRLGDREQILLPGRLHGLRAGHRLPRWP